VSAAGTVGQPVQALGGWQAGIPGLVALPNGDLEAVFAATSPDLVPSVWAIVSADGGKTWSQPTDVKGGGPAEALAYGADVTAALSGSTPVLTLPQAGTLVVQRGLGSGMPNGAVTNGADGAVGGVSTAVDAATGDVVASWQSLNAGRDFIQAVSPKVGAAQAVPEAMKNSVVLAGRDAGPGVFAAYSPDGTHVRLLRYGGGSVAVGSAAGVTAKVLGAATGIDGRIWVMWGDENGGVAVTRSNKAVTRFEALQHLSPNSFTLWRLTGDGRLGPLDLIVHQTPNAKGSVPPPETTYARIRPLLSATFATTAIKNKLGTIIAVKVVVSVTDAGDAVPGATVNLAGKTAKTNGAGKATLQVAGQGGGTVGVTITAPTYRAYTGTVHL
jgi:hypothetical protein